MGTKADRDLWGQVLAIESRYGDRGPEVLEQRIAELREAGELAEAAFWAEVGPASTICIRFALAFPLPMPVPIALLGA